MRWFKRIHLLYYFGFLSNFQPVDPFLYQFFTSYKNLPADEVRQDVLPTLTYSTALHILFVFLFGDLCGYKSLIISASVSNVVATTLRILTKSLFEMEISETFRGAHQAAEIGYYIYIYGYFDVSRYLRATAYIRAAALLGKTASAVLGQLCLNYNWLDFNDLHIVSLAANCLATVLSIFLPTAGDNSYYLSTQTTPHEKLFTKIAEKVILFKSTFIESFHQQFMTRWSLWLICAVCSFAQVSTFIQPLWRVLQQEKINGIAEATLGVVALISVGFAGYKEINWRVCSVVVMFVLSGLQYVLFLSGISLWNGYFIIFHYVDYVLFSAIYYFVVSAISAEIAKSLQKNCFGLVFGFIYFLAYLLNASMVFVINDSLGFKLEPKEQYFVYFIVHLVLYILCGIGFLIKKRVDTVMVRH